MPNFVICSRRLTANEQRFFIGENLCGWLTVMVWILAHQSPEPKCWDRHLRLVLGDGEALRRTKQLVPSGVANNERNEQVIETGVRGLAPQLRPLAQRWSHCQSPSNRAHIN